VIFIGKNRFFW